MTHANKRKTISAAALSAALAVFLSGPLLAVDVERAAEPTVAPIAAPSVSVSPISGMISAPEIPAGLPTAGPSLSVGAEAAQGRSPAASVSAARATFSAPHAGMVPALPAAAAAPSLTARLAARISAIFSPAEAAKPSARESLAGLAASIRTAGRERSAGRMAFDGEKPIKIEAAGPSGSQGKGSGGSGSGANSGSGKGGSELPNRAPVLELDDPIFPGMAMVYTVPSNSPVAANYRRLAQGRDVVAVTDSPSGGSAARPHFPIGTIAEVTVEEKDGQLKARVAGVREVKIIGYSKEGDVAIVGPMWPKRDADSEQALVEMIHELTHVLEREKGWNQAYEAMHYYLDGKGLTSQTVEVMTNDMIGLVGLPNHVLQEMLGQLSIPGRLQMIYEQMNEAAEQSGALDRYIAAQEKQAAQQRRKGPGGAQGQSGRTKSQRGEEGGDPALEAAKTRFEAVKDKMSEEARKKVEVELSKLESLPPQASDYHVGLNYVTLLVEMPWGETTKDNADIPGAKAILDADHYGLEKPKESIIEFLAVRQAIEELKAAGKSAGGKGLILALDGPPGVGKTSLGKSVARALGRKFDRLSLGGVRDEAELRGHRRTYVGALPGKIVQKIHDLGVSNPVILLDEVDKLGKDYKGDPEAALLEILDPEQNSTFEDHYLDVKWDLSPVLFIVTTNQIDQLSGPLRDRLKIIRLSSYTESEKVEIAKRHLIQKQLEQTGLGEAKIDVPEDTLRAVIRGYTREGGVRNLERAIGSMFSKIMARVKLGTGSVPKAITPDGLSDLLGRAPLGKEKDLTKNGVGTVSGLAWTQTGGDVLLVETKALPKGVTGEHLSVTGSLQDVMKESSKLAFRVAAEYAIAHGVDAKAIAEHEFSIHFPDGSTPKDGPSAGITMTTALVSRMTGRAVKPKVAMTGEIILNGEVWPIGGLKEKSIAAYRMGYTDIMIPKANEGDLEDMPDEIKQAVKDGKLTFHPVETAAEVLDFVLEKDGTPLKAN